jgi:hypothetical protein
MWAKGTILFYVVLLCTTLATIGASYSDGH